MTKYDAQIDEWFVGLNRGDLDNTVALFAADHAIKNAANPIVSGPDAARQILTEFFERTAHRHFDLHAVAHGSTMSFAYWTAELAFADDANVAGHTVHPFTARFDGIDTFIFNDHGQIIDVQIVHQTTTVAALAAANAKAN